MPIRDQSLLQPLDSSDNISLYNTFLLYLIYLFIYLLQIKHFLKLALQYLGPFYAGLLWFTPCRTKFQNIQDGKRVTIPKLHRSNTHTHTHFVIIKQSTVLVYTVHSTKKDRGKNIILICESTYRKLTKSSVLEIIMVIHRNHVNIQVSILCLLDRASSW